MLIGVIAGGGANLAVQLWIRHIDQQRARRTAARILYDELTEIGTVEMNDGPLATRDIEHLHQLWRDHRTGLADLSHDEWLAVEAAVLDRARPDCIGPQPRDSHDGRLELALLVLEREAGLPRSRRAFSDPRPLLPRVVSALRAQWNRALRTYEPPRSEFPF